ncbi:unnamed protein product [Caenorhabditis sp. 36 PRJEB53466]|nr:unnamed protein product [Caenorhabditis sp. 36 PRJEB53466]
MAALLNNVLQLLMREAQRLGMDPMMDVLVPMELEERLAMLPNNPRIAAPPLLVPPAQQPMFNEFDPFQAAWADFLDHGAAAANAQAAGQQFAPAHAPEQPVHPDDQPFFDRMNELLGPHQYQAMMHLILQHRDQKAQLVQQHTQEVMFLAAQQQFERNQLFGFDPAIYEYLVQMAPPARGAPLPQVVPPAPFAPFGQFAPMAPVVPAAQQAPVGMVPRAAHIAPVGQLVPMAPIVPAPLPARARPVVPAFRAPQENQAALVLPEARAAGAAAGVAGVAPADPVPAEGQRDPERRRARLQGIQRRRNLLNRNNRVLGRHQAEEGAVRLGAQGGALRLGAQVGALRLGAQGGAARLRPQEGAARLGAQEGAAPGIGRIFYVPNSELIPNCSVNTYDLPDQIINRYSISITCQQPRHSSHATKHSGSLPLA